jgi:hypothetical protein
MTRNLVNETKMQASYQIYRKIARNRFVWVENVEELHEAKGRLEFLSTISDADYILFDPRERAIVARYDKFV